MADDRIDYGPLEAEAVDRATEVLEILEDCFIGYRIDDRPNAINYIATNLQSFRDKEKEDAGDPRGPT